MPKICQGLTKTGDWCNNFAAKGSRYCYLHRTKEEALSAKLADALELIAVKDAKIEDLERDVEYYKSLLHEGR